MSQAGPPRHTSDIARQEDGDMSYGWSLEANGQHTSTLHSLTDRRRHGVPSGESGSGIESARTNKRLVRCSTRIPRVALAGIPVDLLELHDALNLILDHALHPRNQVLGVLSINLDHLHHFGASPRATRDGRQEAIDLGTEGKVRWLRLLDGAPLVKKARVLTGQPWPRLPGSDIIEPILDQAQELGLSLGFLGGKRGTHESLASALASQRPTLRVAGYWAPSREELDDECTSAKLSSEIKEADVDILVVCLGKPRQELWIAEQGPASGAHVCLAFGSVVDLLAGRVRRAPRWISGCGLEWAWRLMREPRRLARRYLIHGSSAYYALQRLSSAAPSPTHFLESETPSRRD